MKNSAIGRVSVSEGTCISRASVGDTDDALNPPGQMYNNSDWGVYLAGEAWHAAHRGTVHGAYLSGQRAAEAIVESVQ